MSDTVHTSSILLTAFIISKHACKY